MSKLIIRHGDRVTEHVLGDEPLVIGRDPQCDLFFADKKLSRRHARFEPGDDGIRLIDLGSRNGCWVNEERVDERILSSSDAIRLGALAIHFEDDAPAAREDEESTVFLTSEDANDSSTVVLASDALPDAPVDESGTVVLSPSASSPSTEDDSATRIVPAPAEVDDVDDGDEDPTLRKSDAVEQPADEATMMLDGAPPIEADTGTVIFRGKAIPEPENDETGTDATQLAPPARGSETHTRAAPGAPPIEPEPRHAPFDEASAVGGVSATVPGSSPSTLRFILLVAAIALLAVVVLAMPLLRTLGNALDVESSLRGRALVELLAVSNEAALRRNQPADIDIERVSREPGVLGAYLLDPMGRVLAPSTSAATPLMEQLGVDIDAREIRAFRESPVGDGASVYALPVSSEGRRLGVAVVHFRGGAAASNWTAVMLMLGSLLLVMGVAAAVLMARRWILLPVQELRDDVEALRQGLVESLAEDRPYSELATIARTFNELAGVSGPRGDVSATFRPELDPTLVPDDRD